MIGSFRRRNINLALRERENTSAFRSFGFNKTTQNDIFKNLEIVLIKYSEIIILMSTAYPFCWARKRCRLENLGKKIDQAIYAEISEFFTFGGISLIGGNTVPELLVFVKVHFNCHSMAINLESSPGEQ